MASEVKPRSIPVGSFSLHERGRSATEEGRLIRPLFLGLSLVAWVGVWAFWLAVTHNFHPTVALALIVTTSLVVAYAVAVYVNHLVLVPRLWMTGRRWRYWAWLAATMALLTAGALAVIRVSYFELVGPDADPNGVYKHYAIDLFGMAAHLLAAAGVVAIGRRLCRTRPPDRPDAEQLNGLECQ
jgi:hypothetical protein